jgi:hypothetical protein
MADTPGMFTGLNKYEAELMDAARQREASSADVGTGWQAMTQAAGRAGGMIGRSVGKALGGVTPAEQRVADFQAITASIPDFNPNKVESLQEMSSALWQGGFYDQAKDMMDTANIYQRNLAEVAKIEAETKTFDTARTLSEKRFILEKDMNNAQIKQINELIFDAQYGRLNEDWELEMKELFNNSQIDQIKQVIEASKAEVTREDKRVNIFQKQTDANVDLIEAQIDKYKSEAKVDESTIRVHNQEIQQSKALVNDLSETDLTRGWRVAVTEGGFDGSLEDYAGMMANLKEVAKEPEISLYEYYKDNAPKGSEVMDIDAFIRSVTGVTAAAEKARATEERLAQPTYKTPSKTELEDIESFVNADIDFGIKDFSGGTDYRGDYTQRDIARQVFYLAQNRGITPQKVWETYSVMDKGIETLMGISLDTGSGGVGAGQGGGSDSGLRTPG